MNAIEIEQFTKIYKGKVKAVDRLDLNVRAGSFFGFVGPNGAGKSTTVNFIAGLIRRNSGTLRILGEEINDDSYEYKRKVGFVLEKPFYIEKLTAREYLTFAGRMFGLEEGLAKKRTEELVEFFELPKDKKTIEKYSTGMKKKVSLAAALIHDPEILILDEPFEGIDAVSSELIRSMLGRMVEKGKTIFLTSHILEIVEKLCSEVAIIDKGRIILQSPIEEIRARFKDEELKRNYSSLEQLFLSLVSGDEKKDSLSWLE